MAESTYYVYSHHFCNGTMYIGKGKGVRAYIPRKHNKHWMALQAKYGSPEVRIVVPNLSEELAFLCESEYLDLVRRLCIKTCNYTAGGEGIAGYKYTSEQLSALSARRSEYMNRPEVRAKYAETTKAYMSRAEVKAYMQERLAERLKSAEYRAKLSEKAKEVSARPEIKAQRRAKFKALWDDPETAEKMRSGVVAMWQNEEKRRALTAKRKEYMNRPEIRAANSERRKQYLAAFGAPNIKKERFRFYSATHGTFVGTRQEFLKAWPEINASKLSALIHKRRNGAGGWVLVTGETDE